MEIIQLYTGCLSQGAYYIASEGEAAIIDPLRETAPYLERAKERGDQIKYIFETHFHADFISGHVDLSQKTGAPIIFGPTAKTKYDSIEAKDGQIFTIGKVSIEVLHTPGHTPESSTYLLRDEEGLEHAIFTGDTLFIGDVGRPDLAQKGTGLTEQELAGMLFDSLRSKIMPLPDQVIVYPAHGAGSACGKNMSKETTDTLGNQKESNYALDTKMSREAFIKELTTGILPPPQYFADNARINKEGYDSLDTVLAKGKIALDPEMFESIANHEGALVLDTRTAQAFVKEHIPNSIFIGIDGGFAPWVGALITDIEQAIVFVAEEGREEEVVTRLSRVGYDNTMGFLSGGLTAWKAAGKETASIESIDVQEFEKRYTEMPTVDVRKPGEYANTHLMHAIHAPLDFVNVSQGKLDPSKPYFIHCAGGYRSVIFISILKARGFHSLINIEGGMGKIKTTSLPQEASESAL